MKNLKKILVSAVILAPNLVAAQALLANPESNGIAVYIRTAVEFINSTLIPFVFALALLLFIWGMYVYFIQGGADEGKRDEGKKLALYAIAGFVLMVSVWGIVNLIAGGLGLTGDLNQERPQIQLENTPS